MLALIYLGLAIALGDLLCRRFYRFVSVPHRYAAAILVGILLSTWFTYLAALAFAHTTEPLIWADLLFFVAAAAAIFWLSRKSSNVEMLEPRTSGRAVYDWVTVAVLFISICVLLLGTLYVTKQGRIRVSGVEASDFALQSAIAQSFALGHNFPAECPYYAGQPLHCDFLFYFQAGNLEFLGLNLAWSVDVLSVLGLTSMLALVIALGELLFDSRVVGCVAAALFFFPGSLAFIPFLKPQGGDTWTPIAFLNQRHLASATGVFLLVLGFLVDQYQKRSQIRASAKHSVKADGSDQVQQRTTPLTGFVMAAKNMLGPSRSFIFSGLLFGALPLWSTSVFIGGAAVLLLLLILFPYRLQVMLLGITAAVLALPQLVFLDLATGEQPLFHWGAIVSNPALAKFIGYIGLMFGAKWPAIIVALILASLFQRRFFLALCSLLLLTVYAGLSIKTSAGYNFLNIWVSVANLFAAYGLCRLWKLKNPRFAGPAAATLLSAMTVLGGVIDLLPIRNSSYVEVNYERDDLVRWLNKNTKSNDVFLTDRFVIEPILLAGRKIFLGGPFGTCPAGPDLAARESICREMYESKNPRRVFELMKQTHINYVAFDDGIRTEGSIKNHNEYLYVRYFQKFYEDKENRYRKLVIYKVPDSVPPSAANMDLPEPAVSAFQGGHGSGKGQFDNPHGIAVDNQSNIFVADTGNGRIEKFSPNGSFVTSIAATDPNGVAVDRAGNIYIAEIDSKHQVQKLRPNGTLIATWAPGLYGPRKIAIGPDDSIYVVDSGRSRIVKFSPDGQVLASWGSEGNGDGQFRGVSSIGVDPINNAVYVADPINSRIQVFDSDGKFLTKWSIPGWGQTLGYEDLAIDSQTGRLYASSAHVNSILVFDLQGNRVGTLTPAPPDKLEGPSALALSNDKLLVLNTASARVSVIDLHNR